MSSGHVFHPGHDEWHGQTVVVFTNGARTVVGRWDGVVGGRLHMHDVAVHEEGAARGDAAGAPESRAGFLARLKQYGIPVEHKDFALAEADVVRVTRLRDV